MLQDYYFIYLFFTTPKNSFSKKVHKYTFGVIQCCFRTEYKGVMQL